MPPPSLFFLYATVLLMSTFSLIAETNDKDYASTPSCPPTSVTTKAEKKQEEESLSEKKEETPEKKEEKPLSEKKEEESSEKKEEEPPKIGNFALPTSQQPAGLFAFGGNVIDKGEVQLFLFADEFIGKRRVVTDVIPSILFGVTDDFSILFNFPFTPIMKDDCFRSSGLEDFYVQLEYAFFNKKTKSYTDQATIVGNVTVPTGSVRRNPATGFGSPSFFLGATYYHTLIDWFVFLGEGAILTTAERGTKIGDQFLYQFGFGRNIPSPKGWIYAWMLEIDGQYSKKNRVRSIIDKNSGGNFIYATPSLWISSKTILIQFGISLPITQNLFGRQHKFDYGLNFNCSWSFY